MSIDPLSVTLGCVCTAPRWPEPRRVLGIDRKVNGTLNDVFIIWEATLSARRSGRMGLLDFAREAETLMPRPTKV
jgi:hypothetical protein